MKYLLFSLNSTDVRFNWNLKSIKKDIYKGGLH